MLSSASAAFGDALSTVGGGGVPGGHQREHLSKALETIEAESVTVRYKHGKPWVNEKGEVIWPWFRVWIACIVRSQTFESLMGVMILANVALIVYETNADAACYPEFLNDLASCPHASGKMFWTFVSNVVLQVIYTAECAARGYAERAGFFRNRWNLLDLFIVIIGWLGMGLTELVNLNVLRIFRVIRLLRAGRLLIIVPELYILVSGLATSMKAIFFGSILLASVIFVWAIVTVELIHPVNVQINYDASRCPRCPKGFETVYTAAMTLFSQIVAGDAWGDMSLPLLETQPWTSVILFAIMMTISLGVMNLILAVIVEKATQARQDNLEEKVRQKELERERNMIELALLCDRMDLDASGTLSVEEMILGYEQEPKMHAVMAECGMEKSDLQTLFNAMDADGSGEVDYVEFCSELGKFYKRDPLVLASMTRHSQAELKKIVEQEVMMALREQTQMMHDQLDLLCKIPGLEKAGGKVKQKWQATSRVSKPPLRLSFSQSSLDGQTGFSSRQISRDGASLAELQAEIDRLLAFSKRLQPTEPVIDLDAPTAERLPEAESSKGVQDATTSVTASDFLRQRVGSGESGGGMTPAVRRRQQWTHLDRKLQEVSLRFQNQIVHEELMRQRCQEIINHLNETVQENLMVSQQM